MAFFKKDEKAPEKTGKSLVAGEKHFRDIFEKSAAGVSIVGLDGRCLDVNDELCKITGYSKKELLAGKITSHIYPDDLENNLKTVKDLLAGKISRSRLENRYIHKRGGIVWVLQSIGLFRDKDNRPRYFIVHSQNITDIKKIEQRLRDSEEKYRTIIEKGSDGIIIIQDSLVKFVNSKMLDLAGYSMKEIQGKPFLSFVSQDFIDLVKNSYLKRLAGKGTEQRYILEIVKKNGQKMLAEVGGSLINYEGKPADMVFLVDVTKKKQTEKDLENAKIAARNVYEDLRLEKDRLARVKAKDEALLESIGEGVIAVDQDDKVILINKAAEGLLGLVGQKIIGKSFIQTISLLNAEGKKISDAERPVVLALNSGKITSAADYYFSRRDGIKFPVAITVTPVLLDAKPMGAIAVFRDITKEKEIEKLRVDFLSLASHQLRTPLSGTKWLIETIQRGIIGELNSKQKEYLNSLYQINERMIRLVSDMLNVLMLESSVVAMKKRKISAAKLSEELFLMMEPASRNKGVALRDTLKNHQSLFIETDLQILRSILECFLSNAISYSQSGQTVVLDVKEEPSAIVFFVKDSGIGIPKEEQKRLFERFYRATNAKKFKPDGTGLGLYTAFLLASKVGGKISFKSRENKGSIFYLRMPKGRTGPRKEEQGRDKS